jgi:hypothetical protein
MLGAAGLAAESWRLVDRELIAVTMLHRLAESEHNVGTARPMYSTPDATLAFAWK